MKLERVNFHISTLQHNYLRRLSDRTQLSVAEHIRRALDHYIEQQKEVERQRRKERKAS